MARASMMRSWIFPFMLCNKKYIRINICSKLMVICRNQHQGCRGIDGWSRTCCRGSSAILCLILGRSLNFWGDLCSWRRDCLAFCRGICWLWGWGCLSCGSLGSRFCLIKGGILSIGVKSVGLRIDEEGSVLVLGFIGTFEYEWMGARLLQIFSGFWSLADS